MDILTKMQAYRIKKETDLRIEESAKQSLLRSNIRKMKDANKRMLEKKLIDYTKKIINDNLILRHINELICRQYLISEKDIDKYIKDHYYLDNNIKIIKYKLNNDPNDLISEILYQLSKHNNIIIMID